MTFLPYSSFVRSAEVLDKKRCWKQVIEAKQIIEILQSIEIAEKMFYSMLPPSLRKRRKIPWENHPAVQMWDGYISALIMYFNVFLDTAKNIFKINTEYKKYTMPESIKFPWWQGNSDFHRAMRAVLIKKKPEFYEPLWPSDNGFNNSKYLWPDMKTKTFKII